VRLFPFDEDRPHVQPLNQHYHVDHVEQTETVTGVKEVLYTCTFPGIKLTITLQMLEIVTSPNNWYKKN